jgi:hypothetical protein
MADKQAAYHQAFEEWRRIQKAYRAREIGDAEFLAGKAKFNKALEAVDAPATYEQGDPLPILASIYSAEKILRCRGIIIDLDREIPNRSASDYWMSLRRLQNDLWNRVHATDSKCQQAAIKKIAEGLRELDTCPLVITKDGTVENQAQDLEQEKRRDNESLETN